MEPEQYLKAMRANWLVIVCLALLGGTLALAWTATQPRVYSATGSLVVTTGPTAGFDDALVRENYVKARIKSYVDIAGSRQVAEEAADEIGDVSADAIAGRVSVSNPPDTAVLNFSATAGSPDDAAVLVDAWMRGATWVLADLESARGSDLSTVEVRTLEPAVSSSAPVSPNVRLMVALGLVGGLVAGIAYALVQASLDRTLRTVEDVEREFTLPVIGALPVDPRIKPGHVGDTTHPATLEAVRQLRTNVQFMDVDSPPRVLVVTSAMPGDGKSTTAVRLAQAIASTGRRVVLVDADLRRPSAATNLGLLDGVGLTDVLVGSVAVDDVLQPYGDSGRLDVLVAGQVPPNPSELLGSDALREVLYGFPEDTMVIVDSPPLIAVTDAAVLTARTDGALVIVRSGTTTVDVLDRALEALHKVNGRPLGLILDRAPYSGSRASTYGYHYASVRAVPVAEADRAPEPEAAAVAVAVAERDEAGLAEGGESAEAAEDAKTPEGAADVAEPGDDEQAAEPDAERTPFKAMFRPKKGQTPPE
ncbi:polysaccharide biosynthesis tyrosine autokinase [Demequina lignilytica]|uniref:Polysaccharide biosynthesis tyrosine autokinase n=1 Tax=Demequina lignilytica TaxID=3051663 RepID=A0AB35MK11_9MICO|nr:polysaccharide biosynthesis tyrosine autokinase [Demequina sp. SYSU T0a273]MDN4484169.1 polysaccharide biosynthesis tyrosine autokinase [Demequina sp. SYSU T0a273]